MSRLKIVEIAFSEIVASISNNGVTNPALISKALPILKDIISSSQLVPANIIEIDPSSSSSYAALQASIVDKLKISSDLAHDILEYNQKHLLSMSLSACYHTLEQHRLRVIESITLMLRYPDLFDIYTNADFVTVDNILLQIKQAPAALKSYLGLLLVERCSNNANAAIPVASFIASMDSSDLFPYILAGYCASIPLHHFTPVPVPQLRSLFAKFSDTWVNAQFRAIVYLHTLIFLKYYMKSCSSDIAASLDFTNEKLDKHVEDLVMNADHSPIKYLSVQFENEWKYLDSDLQRVLYYHSELLVSGFIKFMGRTVKNLKNRDEDVNQPNRLSTRIQQQQIQPSGPQNFESLLKLITYLYAERPDSAYNFWSDPELFKFLKWAADVRSSELKCVYFDMVAALATGTKSAQRAYDLYNFNPQHQYGTSRGISWATLFGSLGHFAEQLTQSPDAEMNPLESKYLRSLLGLLKQVVTYSITARMILYENQQYRVLHNLSQLLDCEVSSILKASLFDAIAAFCKPQTHEDSLFIFGSQQAEITSTVWLILETHQILPQKNGRFVREGLIFDLEENESSSQCYPETLAFLELLNVLFSTMTFHQNIRRYVQSLGAPQRTPGLDPYISFVLKEVFLKIDQRVFAISSERTHMLALCLEIMNKCLEHFEDDCSVFLLNQSLPRLTSLSVDTTANGNFPYSIDDFVHVTHTPGFKIMCEVLSGSKVTSFLFDIIREHDVDTLNSKRHDLNYGKSILTALAIIYRILNSQMQFLNDFIPMALEWSNLVTQTGLKAAEFPASIVGLDRLLAYHVKIVISIAMQLNCTVDDQIVLLATRIMRVLSYRPVFLVSEVTAANPPPKFAKKVFRQSRIVALFNASEERDRILEGFATRLGEASENSSEDLVIEEYQLTKSPLEFQGPEYTEKPGYANAVRTAILDLMLGPKGEEVPRGSDAPTFAHFLLGYDCTRPLSQSEINISRQSHSCLYEIIKLLSAGTESIALSSHRDVEDEYFKKAEPLHLRYPALSERCYHLIYKLCESPTTSAPTMRFLRTNNDFLYRQIGAMPVGREDADKVMSESNDRDGALRERLASLQVCEMHRRSWLMKTAALDLFNTIQANQKSYTQKLVNILFLDRPAVESDMDFDDYGQEKFEQPLTKILEILNSMEGIGESENYDDRFFMDLPMSSFLNTNERGAEVYDVRALHLYLKNGQSSLDIPTPKSDKDVQDILYNALQFNSTQEVRNAQSQCFRSWASIVMVAMTDEGFQCLPADSREDMLYEILATLLPILNSDSTRIEITIAMSGTVLALVSKLNWDRSFQSILQAPPITFNTSVAPSFSSRLHGGSMQKSLLKGILDGILRAGSHIFMRGCFYASLLEYIQYTMPDELDENSGSSSSHRSNSVTTNASLFRDYGIRLYDVVSRDACEGEHVWRAVSYNLLSAVYGLYQKAEPSSNPLLEFLYEKSYMKYFVKMLKLSNDALEAVLEDLMNQPLLQAVYTFEAQMTFFLRACESLKGTHYLLDCNIIDALCSFRVLSLSPENDFTTGMASFLLIERLLHPTLRLLSAILCQVGSVNIPLLSKISQFVSVHSDVILGIMKDKTPRITLFSLEILQLTTLIVAHLPRADHANWSLSNQAIISLLSKYSATESWLPKLVPVTEQHREMEKNFVTVPGSNQKVSVFINEANTIVSRICRNVLNYSQAVTKEQPFKPVFRWSEVTNSNELSHFSSPPMLSILINYLNTTISLVEQVVLDRNTLKGLIGEVQKLGSDDIATICLRSTEAFQHDLSQPQRRLCAARQLQRDVNEKLHDFECLLYSIEQLLVLLWRHISYFLQTATKSETDAIRLMIRSIDLDKLASLEIPVGNADARAAFLNMVIRKIRGN